MSLKLLFPFLLLFPVSLWASELPPDTLLQWKETQLIGNKRTKPDILLREFDLSKDSFYTPYRLAEKLLQTKKNLVNLQLFNFVTVNVDSLRPDSNGIYQFRIKVTVIERWFRWPVPIVELADRNFNQWWISKDLSRLNYGFFFIDNNVRGRNEYLKLKLQVGYTHKYEIIYEVPYLNRDKKIGAFINLMYSSNREVGYVTKADTLRFFRDPGQILLKRWQSYLGLSYRPGLFSFHTIQAGWNQIATTDSVAHMNPDYLGAGEKKRWYIQAQYQFTYNRTDLISYPTKGRWLNAKLQWIGFGGKNSEQLLLAQLNLANYARIYGPHYTYIWATLGVNATSGRIPYYFSKALGYDRFLRGYQYQVVDGRSYAMTAIGYKYNILPQQVIKIPFLPLTQFNRVPFAIYTTCFSDFGYVNGVNSNDNRLPNKFLASAGVGVDAVTYYDKVIRIEYAITKEKTQGFFVQFKALF